MNRISASLVLVIVAAGLLPHVAAASPYATSVVAQSTTGFGNSPYDDPQAVLGKPTTDFFDPIGFWSGGDTDRLVKMVEPAYNTDLDGNKVITTLNRKMVSGSFVYAYITVKFDEPITDNPANPYGIDLQVFGNSFYVGGGTSGGFVNDETNMETGYYLAGGIFGEPVVVSVSPDGSNWYTYAGGPFGDTAFATHAYKWDRAQFAATGYGWTNEEMDFTKPVNPTLDPVLGTGDSGSPYYRLFAADAIDLYCGSGGGTGIDLAESGFASVQYVRVEATADYLAGEIDAISDVRPMVVGDDLCVTPANIGTAAATLYFQDPADVTRTMVRAEFTSASHFCAFATDTWADPASLALVPGAVLGAYDLTATNILGWEAGALAFSADLRLLADGYAGDGSDLSLLSWNGSSWDEVPFTFDPTGSMVLLSGWSEASSQFVISQEAAPVAEPGLGGMAAVAAWAALRRRKRA
jgi:hypothetical protein